MSGPGPSSGGYSGYSGASGRSGYSGYSGYSGGAGGAGTSGYSGYSGSASGITVGDTQVLFADGANNPAGDAGMVYNKTTDVLTIGVAATSGGVNLLAGQYVIAGAGAFPVVVSAASTNSGVFLNGTEVGFSVSTSAKLSVTATAATFLVPPIPPTYTVGTLPTPAAAMIAYVTDGDGALAWGATVVNTGAGATKYLVWYNGTNWTVYGK